mgnify:CR=1 FL=1
MKCTSAPTRAGDIAEIHLAQLEPPPTLARSFLPITHDSHVRLPAHVPRPPPRHVRELVQCSASSLLTRQWPSVDAALAPWCPLYQDLKVSPADLTGKNVIFTGCKGPPATFSQTEADWRPLVSERRDRPRVREKVGGLERQCDPRLSEPGERRASKDGNSREHGE